MAAISAFSNPWRDTLRRASWRGVEFHVEAGGQTGGRRVVVHEFPKRNTPYAEDMGKRATTRQVTGYLIGPNYLAPRNRLMRALDADGPGRLILPLMQEMTMMCINYSVEETREMGGYCTFVMTFVEAGAPYDAGLGQDTMGVIGIKASAAENSVAQSFSDAALSDFGGGP